MSEASLRKILYPAAALAILGFYLYFTLPGLRLYFDNDDMMNLYFAWSKPVIESYRPLGAWFYREMFAGFGFNTLPFRIACLVLGAVNLGLCAWFVHLATGSGRVTALAALIFAFHSRLMEVWFRTAVVYDLLCFTFFYLAACLYVGQRERGGMRSVAIVLCFLLSLAAKEIAVVLPVILIAWNLTRQDRSSWRLPVLCGLIDVPYLWYKTHGAGALTAIVDYQPQYTLTRFAHTWALYLNYLFLLKDQIQPWMAMVILTALLVVAVISRRLLFAWVLLFVPVLPVAFLEYRGAFVLYVSYLGWALYAATLLTQLQDLVKSHKTLLASLAFLAVGWRWGKANLHDQRADARVWLHQSPDQVRQLADALPALAPQLRLGARCLFLADPFSTDEWTPYFMMKLFYRDDTLVADRVKMMNGKTPDPDGYSFVFTYENGQYRRLKP